MSIFLASTNDLINLITESSLDISIDVYASYVDLNTSTNSMTPGRTNTSITSATTTTIIGSPSSNIVRKIKFIRIKNIDGYDGGDGYAYGESGFGLGDGYSCMVTVQHTDGSTIVQLDKRNLGPGDSIVIGDEYNRIPAPSSYVITKPTHYGVIAGAYGDGDPSKLLSMCQNNGVGAATPTFITVTVARCSFFRLPFNMTVNKIRFYGVGATTAIYHAALYRFSDLVRLTDDFNFDTAANTWGSIGDNLGLSLTANTLYFMACGVDSTGTTAGILTFSSGSSYTSQTGAIAVIPGDKKMAGSLGIDNGNIQSYLFQMTVSFLAGGLVNPATIDIIKGQGAWSGGIPAFWLDSDNS